jgi:hypothetical protein
MCSNMSQRWRLPAFTTTSQNVAVAAARLNTLPATLANDGGKVCRRLKRILDVTAV